MCYDLRIRIVCYVTIVVIFVYRYAVSVIVRTVSCVRYGVIEAPVGASVKVCFSCHHQRIADGTVFVTLLIVKLPLAKESAEELTN